MKHVFNIPNRFSQTYLQVGFRSAWNRFEGQQSPYEHARYRP